MDVAGLTWLEPTLDIAIAFHHAVLGAQQELDAVTDRLREATATGGYASYADIANYLADLPTPRSQSRWLNGEPAVRNR